LGGLRVCSYEAQLSTFNHQGRPIDRRHHYAQRDAWLADIAADARLSSLACRISIFLLKFFNVESGEAWPSIGLLARLASASERGVQKAIAQLVECNHLSVTAGGGRKKPNRYRMAFQNGEPAFRNFDAKGEQQFTVSDNETLNARSENPEHAFAKTPNVRSPEHWNEPRKEEREKAPPPLNGKSDQPQHRPNSDQVGITCAGNGDTDFDRFCTTYPKVVNRVRVQRAWATAIAEGADPDRIIAGASTYSRIRTAQHGHDPAQLHQFTADASNWLRDRRWEDRGPGGTADPTTLDGTTGEPIPSSSHFEPFPPSIHRRDRSTSGADVVADLL
jgi:hypothetical protein